MGVEVSLGGMSAHCVLISPCRADGPFRCFLHMQSCRRVLRQHVMSYPKYFVVYIFQEVFENASTYFFPKTHPHY